MSPHLRGTSHRVRLLGFAAVALGGSALLAGVSCASARSGGRAVVIRAFEYQPTSVTVQVGDTVTWTNHDIVPHTATATSGTRFDSGGIDARQSWRYVARQKGTHAYECTFHRTMTGTLVVR